MNSKRRLAQNSQPIRWKEADWFALADVAKSLGITRSEFIRGAAMKAAEDVALGVVPYFVSEAKASPQNTHINFFLRNEDKSELRRSEIDVPDCSRSDCVAKVGLAP